MVSENKRELLIEDIEKILVKIKEENNPEQTRKITLTILVALVIVSALSSVVGILTLDTSVAAMARIDDKWLKIAVLMKHYISIPVFVISIGFLIKHLNYIVESYREFEYSLIRMKLDMYKIAWFFDMHIQWKKTFLTDDSKGIPNKLSEKLFAATFLPFNKTMESLIEEKYKGSVISKMQSFFFRGKSKSKKNKSK